MSKKHKKNQYHRQEKRTRSKNGSSNYVKNERKKERKDNLSENTFIDEKELSKFTYDFYELFNIVANDFVKKGKVVYEDCTKSMNYTIRAEKDGSGFKICPQVADSNLLKEAGLVNVRIGTVYAKYPYDADEEAGFNMEIQGDFKEELTEKEVEQRLAKIKEFLELDIAVLYTFWAFIETHLNALLPKNLQGVTNSLNLSKEEKEYSMVATSQKILGILSKFKELEEFVKLYNSAFL